jgi:2-dehydro-3-deoxyphosphogluconate aldolase / (4S)-4-hydroxy-2-oxoglutarate aldolase
MRSWRRRGECLGVATATASEAMSLADMGYRVLKFFPAEPAGGIAALKGLGAPLADLEFCPTGGIDAAKAPAYLALPNVAAVGGSWVAPAKAVASGDWAAITGLAKSVRTRRKRTTITRISSLPKVPIYVQQSNQDVPWVSQCRSCPTRL